MSVIPFFLVPNLHFYFSGWRSRRRVIGQRRGARGDVAQADPQGVDVGTNTGQGRKKTRGGGACVRGFGIRSCCSVLSTTQGFLCSESFWHITELWQFRQRAAHWLKISGRCQVMSDNFISHLILHHLLSQRVDFWLMFDMRTRELFSKTLIHNKTGLPPR